MSKMLLSAIFVLTFFITGNQIITSSITQKQDVYTLDRIVKQFEDEGLLLTETEMNPFFKLNSSKNAAYKLSKSYLYFYIFDSEKNCLNGKDQIEKQTATIDLAQTPSFHTFSNVLVVCLIHPQDYGVELDVTKGIEKINKNVKRTDSNNG